MDERPSNGARRRFAFPGEDDDDLDPDEMQARKESKRRRRRRRRAKAVAILPTLCTLGNLIAGFAAIYYASKPLEWRESIAFVPESAPVTALTMAGMLIFIGMFFDAIDGFVARLTHNTSDLGAYLDSLADIVTFGVAPAYLTLQLVSKYYQADGETFILSPTRDDMFARVFWAIAAVYLSCTALRLARFNVETASANVADHMFFRGLPAPGAAGCVASLILLHQTWLAGAEYHWAARLTGLGMAFVMLLCALAMVSRYTYVHVINRYIRGNASFSYVVKLVIIFVFGLFYPIEALAIGFTAYALSAPVQFLSRTWTRVGRKRA